MWEQYRLGEESDLIDIASAEEHRRAAAALAGQCRRELQLLSRELAPEVYDTPGFTEAVRRLALDGRGLSVRILVWDPRSLTGSGHRLLELSQRLSSFIQLRVPAEEHREFSQAFLVADERGYIHQPLADRYEAQLCFNGPARARELKHQFELFWEKAVPDPELRRQYP